MPFGELASDHPPDDSTERDRDDHRRRREWGHSHVPHPCSFPGSSVGDGVGLCRGLACLCCWRTVEGPARESRDLSGLRLLLGCVGMVVAEVWRRADSRVSHRPPPEPAENCVVARTSSGPSQELGRHVNGPAPAPGRQAGKATGSGRQWCGRVRAGLSDHRRVVAREPRRVLAPRPQRRASASSSGVSVTGNQHSHTATAILIGFPSSAMRGRVLPPVGSAATTGGAT